MILVCCILANTGLMIISHDQLLNRNINRLLNVHRFFARILYGYFDFADLNNSFGFKLLWVNNRLLLLLLLLTRYSNLRTGT